MVDKKTTEKSAEEVAEEVAAKVGQWSESMYETWDSFLDKIEESDNPRIKAFSTRFLRRISIEAPVVVGYVFACIFLHILNMTVLPGISMYLGVDDYINLTSPMQYIRMITHIFGHDGIPHLRGNMTHLLLVGPSAEAAFGSIEILQIMFLVAISSGVAHIMVGRAYSRQLGASGVVFALILLNSMVSAKSGRIPLSFLMTAGLWIGDELWRFFFSGDKTSHHGHLAGALVGTLGGYYIHQRNEKKRMQKIASKWKTFKKN